MYPNEQLAVQARAGDKKALEALVRQNKGVVVRLASRYRYAPGHTQEDLQQAATVGLLEATYTWDPSRHTRWLTHAYWHMRCQVAALVLPDWCTSSGVQKVYWRISRESARFYCQHGRDPSVEELAEILGVSVRTVEKALLRLSHPDMSLDAYNPETQTQLHDVIGADDSGYHYVDQTHDHAWAQALADQFVSTLTDRDRYIWDHRVVSTDPQTHDTIGQALGLSRQRVQQLERGIVQAFRGFAKNK
jgi:RNA polymerase sigma-32 factor